MTGLTDSPERIKRRLDEYKAREGSLLDFYTKQGIVFKIDAEGPVENVQKKITDALRPIL